MSNSFTNHNFSWYTKIFDHGFNNSALLSILLALFLNRYGWWDTKECVCWLYDVEEFGYNSSDTTEEMRSYSTFPFHQITLEYNYIWCDLPITDTNVPVWSATLRVIPEGYITSTSGRNTQSTMLSSLIDFDAKIVISWSRVRGYFDKSSVGANCDGFTNMDTTTFLHVALAWVTRHESVYW